MKKHLSLILTLFVLLFFRASHQADWSLSPDRGPTTGETQIIVHSEEFLTLQNPNSTYPDPACYFGTTPDPADWVICPKTSNLFCLSCSSPAVSAPKNVTFGYSITGSSNNRTATDLTFIYYNSPFLIKISPVYGPLSGGTTITISGANFLNYGSWLQCGIGTVLVQAKYVNSSTIECITPPSSVSNTPIPIRVTQNLLHFTEQQIFFVYRSNPIFVSDNPSSGPVQGGTNVTIAGLNLDPTEGLSQILPGVQVSISPYIQFGDGSKSKFTIVSDKQGWVISPKNSAQQTVDLLVTYNDKDYISTGLKYTYYASPEVIELVPNYAYIDETTLTVKVLGLNFLYSDKIYAKYGENGTTVDCTYISVSEIDCKVPAAPIKGVFYFYLQSGNFAMFNTYLNFTFYAIPSIIDFQPKSGLVSGNTRLNVVGDGFLIPENNNTYCLFQNQFKTPATIINSTLLYCSTPQFQGISKVELSAIIDTRTVSSQKYFYYYEASRPDKYEVDLTSAKLSYKLPSTTVQMIYSSSIDGYIWWVPIGQKITLSLTMPYAVEQNLNITGLNLTQGYKRITNYGMIGKSLSVGSNVLSQPSLVQIFISLNDQQYNNTGAYVLAYSSPAITGYYPTSVPISGGNIINVYGSSYNLGLMDISPSYLCMFTLADGTLISLDYAADVSDNCIKCISPSQQQTTTLTLSIAVYGDAMMNVGAIQLYGNPIITSVSPSTIAQLAASSSSYITLTGQNFQALACDACIPQCVFIYTQDQKKVVYSTAEIQNDGTVYCDIPSIPLPGNYIVGYMPSAQDQVFSNSKVVVNFYNSFITKAVPSLLGIKSETQVYITGLGFANTSKIVGTFIANDGKTLLCSGSACKFSVTYWNETYLSFTAPQQSKVTTAAGAAIGENQFYIEISLYGDSFTKNALILRYFDISTKFVVPKANYNMTIFSLIPFTVVASSNITVPTDMSPNVITSTINPQCIITINNTNFIEPALIVNQELIAKGTILSLSYSCFYKAVLPVGQGTLNMTLGDSTVSQVSFVQAYLPPKISRVIPRCVFYSGGTD